MYQKIDISNLSITHFFFIGIGGIGMSALARYFNAKGANVMGYDKTITPLTNQLVEEGISIHFEDTIHHIPEYCTPENTIVIYTPAIPKNHKQFHFFKENQFSMKKRAEILGDITKNRFTIAVAGTHGKTTTSTMIAHLLKVAGINVTAFLGGISTNYNSNLLLGTNTENEIIVVEADEFDRSFLTLSPNIAVITSVEADHLDIYGTGNELKKSFIEFSKNIEEDGCLIVHFDFAKDFNYDFQYSLSEGDFKCQNLTVQQRKFVFEVITPNNVISNIQLAQPGFHNAENAIAAIAVALELGINENYIKEAFDTFNGVKRRFDWQISNEKLVYIDDYAHHPTEIKQFITSVKKLIPSMKLTVVFQPHLFSRTRDFALEFSESLSLADEVILLEIYPARELPIEGVNAAMLLENITCEKSLLTNEELLHKLRTEKIELLATLGAGDIDNLVEPIKQILLKNA